jgi:hypothetical protein
MYVVIVAAALCLYVLRSASVDAFQVHHVPTGAKFMKTFRLTLARRPSRTVYMNSADNNHDPVVTADWLAQPVFAGAYPSAATVKQLIPMSAVVKDYINGLSAHGYHANWQQLSSHRFRCSCPLGKHTDSTPSFHVSDDKQFFHCFGCGSSGDIFRFVENTENCSFVEALHKISAKHKLSAPRGDQAATQATAEVVYKRSACTVLKYFNCEESAVKSLAPSRKFNSDVRVCILECAARYYHDNLLNKVRCLQS